LAWRDWKAHTGFAEGSCKMAGLDHGVGPIAEVELVREAYTVRSLGHTGFGLPVQVAYKTLVVLVPSNFQKVAHSTSNQSYFDSSIT